MTTADRKILENKLRRRYYVQPDVDPIEDASIVAEKVSKSSCFGAVVSVLAIAAVLAGVLL